MIAVGELWEQIGEELPFQVESTPSNPGRKSSAVPAGDYFTVIKGVVF